MTTEVQMLTILASLLVGTAVGLAVYWLGPAWDVLTVHYAASFYSEARALHLDDRDIPRYLRWWGFCLLGSFIILGPILNMYALAVGAAYLVFVAPRFLLQAWVARRRSLMRDQMVTATVALANEARAGLSLPQGLEAISQEIPAPLGLEFRRIVLDYQRGRPLPESIDEARRRLNLEGFTLFAAAVLVSLERGGKVTEALEQISRTLQENQRLERKLEADTASGRKVVVVLTAFPMVFLGGMYLLDPSGMTSVFDHPAGQFVLLAVGILVYAAARWSHRILSLDF